MIIMAHQSEELKAAYLNKSKQLRELRASKLRTKAARAQAEQLQAEIHELWQLLLESMGEY